MRQRILFIDDEQSPRKVFAHILRQCGYDVLEADNGRAGMEQLVREPIDLVITDMIMPVMDGVETILAVRGQHPRVKIIAAAESRFSPAENFLKIARQLGSHKTLTKPFVPQELLSTVRELLG